MPQFENIVNRDNYAAKFLSTVFVYGKSSTIIRLCGVEPKWEEMGGTFISILKKY